MIRFLFVLFLLMVGSCALTSGASFAAGYPDHNIQIILPYPPGGQGDTACRMLIEDLEKLLGTRIIPNNRPGAGTVVQPVKPIRRLAGSSTLHYLSFHQHVRYPEGDLREKHQDEDA